MRKPEYGDETVPSHKYNFLKLGEACCLSELCGMKNEQAQRRIIAAALFPANSHSTVPSAYEQFLTDKYIDGSLTIYQSIELLEEYHRTNAVPILQPQR
ncbi:hypothetical protein [Hymenobacter sp. BT559]|uniref:hypothetical protein n=1 Tax=Hymenobacter sp. BT559 TaxID=2795729 RepID=UPI0018EDEAF6|nr:hypothetical protein [Hymenobacter sp. BT559]MBJ6143926.1 hypothetical protein [Hymenobacter sp. BT559]